MIKETDGAGRQNVAFSAMWRKGGGPAMTSLQKAIQMTRLIMRIPLWFIPFCIIHTHIFHDDNARLLCVQMRPFLDNSNAGAIPAMVHFSKVQFVRNACQNRYRTTILIINGVFVFTAYFHPFILPSIRVASCLDFDAAKLRCVIHRPP